MPNTLLRSCVLGGWFVTLAGIVGVSVANGAHPTTTAALFALAVMPAVIAALLGRNSQPPTVAEILHSAEATDGRR